MNITLPASRHTLLDQLERKGIAVETHCRSGFCGMCRCKLVEGEISYQEEPIAFHKDGEILLCCASAKSDITIQI